MNVNLIKMIVMSMQRVRMKMDLSSVYVKRVTLGTAKHVLILMNAPKDHPVISTLPVPIPLDPTHAPANQGSQVMVSTA